MQAGRPKSSGRTGEAPSKRTINSVARALTRAYGAPDLGNVADPLDELIYIMISTMTTGPSFQRVFASLKSRFHSWSHALEAGVRPVKSALRPAGLSAMKARNIILLLRQIRDRFGKVNLTGLRRMSTSEAERFLISLPGVGVKTARCVLMYSLDRPVFPVDTHCLRIASRLGWIAAKRLSPSVADHLQSLIPPPLRHDLHVAMVAHGRAVCKAITPLCTECALRRYCPAGAMAPRGQVDKTLTPASV